MSSDWPLVPLEKLIETLESGSRPSGGATLEDDGVPSLGGQHLTWGGTINFLPKRYIPREHFEKMKRGIVRPGDVLIVKDGATTAKAALFPNNFPSSDVAINEHLFLMRPIERLISAEYLAMFLIDGLGRNQVLKSFQGAAIGGIKQDFTRTVKVPLPPLSEQQRIVEILQQAEEIRRLREDAQKKTTELIPAIFEDMFNSAEQTKFQRLDTIADVVSGVALGRKKKGFEQEVPYIRVANVQAGYMDLSEIKETPATEDEVEQFKLYPGDVLMTEGGDFDKLGRGALWEGQVSPCIHQNHIFRVRPYVGKLNSFFFVRFLQSARAIHYFLRCAKKTTNLASINLSQLRALPVPKIAIERQEEFEQAIRLALQCDVGDTHKLEKTLSTSLSAHAFSGELTKQWREDNAERLEQEARERDAALTESGTTITLSRKATLQETEAIFEDRKDGIYANLSDEQYSLIRTIHRLVGGVDYIRYFTSESLASSIEEPPLRHNPRAIEGHLAVLSARGIIIPLSREEPGEGSAEMIYSNAYRLPHTEQDNSLQTLGGEPLKTFAGETMETLGSMPADQVRISELERLGLKVERGSK